MRCEPKMTKAAHREGPQRFAENIDVIRKERSPTERGKDYLARRTDNSKSRKLEARTVRTILRDQNEPKRNGGTVGAVHHPQQSSVAGDHSDRHGSTQTLPSGSHSQKHQQMECENKGTQRRTIPRYVHSNRRPTDTHRTRSRTRAARNWLSVNTRPAPRATLRVQTSGHLRRWLAGNGRPLRKENIQ